MLLAYLPHRPLSLFRERFSNVLVNIETTLLSAEKLRFERATVRKMRNEES